jgi:FMN phosphatase YigB (HAD superfamily)
MSCCQLNEALSGFSLAFDFDETYRRFRVPVSLRITAQRVRSYKPAHHHFLRTRLEIGNTRWLHAAASFFHDIRPAGALGIPAAWINRKGQPLPAGASPPLRQTRNLTELADWLPAGSPRNRSR